MSLKVDVTIHAFVIYKGKIKAGYSYNNFNAYILYYSLCILSICGIQQLFIILKIFTFSNYKLKKLLCFIIYLKKYFRWNNFMSISMAVKTIFFNVTLKATLVIDPNNKRNRS